MRQINLTLCHGLLGEEKMLHKFRILEENIDLNKFNYKKENIWPVFRNKIALSLIIKEEAFNISNNIQKNKLLKMLKLFLINLFKFPLLLRKYDYILFTNVDDYRYVDTQNLNRLTHEIALHLKDAKILEIQSGLDMKENKELKHINYLSSSVIIGIRILFSKFIKVDNSEKISSELSKYNICLPVNKMIKDYLAYTLIYKFLFKYMKPKMVITTCYSSIFVVKVANDLDIDTLELQHGIVPKHFAYSIFESVNSSFYPKSMAVLGKQDKEYLENMYYVSDKKHIFSMGNMLIEHYQNINNSALLDLQSSYKCVIAVTLQWTVFSEVIEYIKAQALINKQYCFILIPRKKDELECYDVNLDNIKVFLELSCYEIIANSDYHLTVYSTCAFEVPSMGVKNIFLNVNNLSKKYFLSYIKAHRFNAILELDEDIFNHEIFNISQTKEEIIDENKEYIYASYKENMQYMLKELKC